MVQSHALYQLSYTTIFMGVESHLAMYAPHQRIVIRLKAYTRTADSECNYTFQPPVYTTSSRLLVIYSLPGQTSIW